MAQSAPSMWKARGRVPAEYCPGIEHFTRKRGEPVTCEQLRPDIPWGVLRDQPTSTPILPPPTPDTPPPEQGVQARMPEKRSGGDRRERERRSEERRKGARRAHEAAVHAGEGA
ncbi:YdaS family helix-turn-helix protein [Caldimonas tepidiphila]|uniref:YdaS family helix-turn-helix protein n=1 Tax=Caldimonas tepidiphila TaxID=2315841 RepID=UPI003AF3825E